MTAKLSLRAKGILIVTTPVIASLAFIGGLIFALNQAEQDLKHEMFGLRLTALSSNMLSGYNRAVLAARVWHSTRSPSAGEIVDKQLVKLHAQEEELRKLVQGYPEIEKQVAITLQDSVPAREFLIKLRNGASRHFGGDLDPRIFHKNKLMFMESLVDDFGKLTERGEDILHSNNGGDNRSTTMVLMAIGALTNIVVAAILAAYFSRNITGRLAVVKDNANRLALGQPLTKPLGDGDEISDLDQKFHQMALALQEAAGKEKALLDNATDVLCSIDADLRFVRVSAASARAWGYRSEDLLGLRVAQILSGEVNSTIAALASLTKPSAQGANFDAQLQRKDGRIIDTQFSCYWSQAEAALFCVVRDVTREREFERIKQQLMDTIAHDLRSPIASIKVVLDSLILGTGGQLTDAGLQRVERAEQSADRLLRLVNDLLDYEKFESGKFTLNLSERSVQDIMHESALAVEGLVEKQQLNLKIEGDDFGINVDSDRITQAIVNLLANAIKFSPKGEAITMTCARNGTHAQIEIRDRGPGIPDAVKDQIFERFKQVEETAHTHKGTGLGLPIARQIIESHSGNIGVKNNPGGGTIFWFTVPLSNSDGKAQA